MRDFPEIIDQRPAGRGPRAGMWIRSRRLSLAAALALVQVLAVLILRPSTLFVSALVFIVLVISVMLIGRTRGVLRDLLLVVAIAQGLVLLIPLVIGFSFVLGLIAAAVILALLVAAALRLGR